MESKTLDKIPYLPKEIIIHILLRLPVKVLVRFKSTSKSWRSLILSEHFINAHLKNSTKNPTSTHHRILLVSEKSNYELQHCSLQSLSLKQVTDAKRGEFPIDKSVHSLNLVGSCNGLICILINKKDFFMWNPATTESKKLSGLVVSGNVSEHGFGFDESSGDYKIYVVSDRCSTIGNIYSLKKDSWTKINKPIEDCNILSSKTGTFVGGNLHWIRAKEDPDRRWYNSSLNLKNRWYISSLDLKNEVYQIVEQPSVMDDYSNMTFGVFNGCLSMLYHYQNHESIDLWVLKQYGVKDSWSKLMTFFNRDQLDFWIPPSYLIAPNEEVLFKFGPKIGIAAYNPKDNHSWNLIFSTALDKFVDLDIYVESLVSISYK